MTEDKAIDQIAQYITKNIPSQGTIGFGSGSTVNRIIETLSKKDLQVVSASSSTSYKLDECGIKELSIASVSSISLCIDGADQVYISEKPYIIKGHGGAMVKEKILWSLSSKILVAINSSKLVNQLTAYFPVEITPVAHKIVTNQLLQLPLAGLSISLRTFGRSKTPIITDNHNYILDLYYNGPLKDPVTLHNTIKQFTGVVDTGLFVNEETNNAKIIVGYSDHVEIK